jgi:hypothetical protein
MTKKRIQSLSYAGTSTPTYMMIMRQWRMMVMTCPPYSGLATLGGLLQRPKGTERVNLRHLPSLKSHNRLRNPLDTLEIRESRSRAKRGMVLR